jgi:hypothetical protein
MDEDIELSKFSDCFWKFIKENVGIKKVNFNLTNKEIPSKVKKVFDFNTVYEEIKVKLQKAHHENDLLDKDDEELAKW